MMDGKLMNDKKAMVSPQYFFQYNTLEVDILLLNSNMIFLIDSSSQPNEIPKIEKHSE